MNDIEEGLQIIEDSRKHAAGFMGIIILGIICPIMAIPVVGKMVLEVEEANFDESKSDSHGGGPH